MNDDEIDDLAEDLAEQAVESIFKSSEQDSSFLAMIERRIDNIASKLRQYNNKENNENVKDAIYSLDQAMSCLSECKFDG